MIGERKRVRKNDRFVEPDVFRPGTVGGWGRLRSRRRVCRSQDLRTGQTEDALGANRNLPRAIATALENRKPFDLRWQQGGSWKPLTAKSAQAARNYTRGRASNASRRWPRRSDC